MSVLRLVAHWLSVDRLALLLLIACLGWIDSAQGAKVESTTRQVRALSTQSLANHSQTAGTLVLLLADEARLLRETRQIAAQIRALQHQKGG